jgi:hypothetical protein
MQINGKEVVEWVRATEKQRREFHEFLLRFKEQHSKLLTIRAINENSLPFFGLKDRLAGRIVTSFNRKSSNVGD